MSFSNGINTPPGTNQTSTCYSTTLAKSTQKNNAYLKQYVSELTAGGVKYYSKAFEKAFDLMSSVDDNRFAMQERGDYTLLLTSMIPHRHSCADLFFRRIRFQTLHRRKMALSLTQFTWFRTLLFSCDSSTYANI